jgi:hypothetical protein
MNQENDNQRHRKKAEDYCLAAIDVEGHRHNPHKNLGLVYQGQGRWLDAALSFLTAYELNPRDPRAWHHLEQVLAARPALLKQSESLRAGVEAMQKAMQPKRAKARPRQALPSWLVRCIISECSRNPIGKCNPPPTTPASTQCSIPSSATSGHSY